LYYDKPSIRYKEVAVDIGFFKIQVLYRKGTVTLIKMLTLQIPSKCQNRNCLKVENHRFLLVPVEPVDVSLEELLDIGAFSSSSSSSSTMFTTPKFRES